LESNLGWKANKVWKVNPVRTPIWKANTHKTVRKNQYAMAAPSPKGKIFYAEFPKGYSFKVAIDGKCVLLQRGTFVVTTEGMMFRQADEAGHVLIDGAYQRKNLPEYKCPKDIYFNLNLNHFHRMLKNIKKKDYITMYIEEAQPERLFLVVRQTDTKANPSELRTEKIFIVIKMLQLPPEIMDLPDFINDEDGNVISVYKYPKVIKSTEIQKMKKMINVAKIINVKMQGSHYISFDADKGELFGTEFEYGLFDESTDADEFENMIYEAKFGVQSFTLLTKLPGMCSHMQFYIPTVPHYPLKVSMDGIGLGPFNIYIKNAEQIDLEQKQKEAEGN